MTLTGIIPEYVVDYRTYYLHRNKQTGRETWADRQNGNEMEKEIPRTEK